MSARRLDREIVRLAVPALGALLAEPLFLAVDAAMVGHLGVDALAAQGVASAVLTTAVGLMVFLAYATTPEVAGHVGRGDLGRAISTGIDGIWLALGLGVLLASVGIVAAPWLVAVFGADAAVSTGAVLYLRLSLLGLPALLVTLAATGLLRGLQDTLTPLVVSGAGFAANAALNAVLIYGAGWGLAGSAIGTTIAQWAMAVAYAVIAVRLARRHRAGLRPHRTGISGSARSGGWLFLRTLSLRAATLGTVWAATSLGTHTLAGWQLVFTAFTLTAFAMDALAIAAQAMIGLERGRGDAAAVRHVTRRTMAWGAVSGAVLGAVLAALSGVWGMLFTGDPEVAALVQPALVVMALAQPVAGVVFVLDGVLMGAGEARYLALAGVIALAPVLAVLAGILAAAPSGASALAWISASYCVVYVLARAATLLWRVRSLLRR